MNYFFLPDCDNAGIVDAVERIVARSTKPPVDLHDIRLIENGKRLTRCQATRSYVDGRGEELPYSIYWDPQNNVTVEVFRKS